MKFSTDYLGLKLRNPLIVGASPFCDNLGAAVQLQDAGAAAIVMRSLFEEQIDMEQRALTHHVESSADSYSEAASFFPNYEEYMLTPDHYLRQIEKLKAALSIPVIASLNGMKPGGWTDYAQRFESAGADAIELNLYHLVTDPHLCAEDVEADLLATVKAVTSTVKYRWPSRSRRSTRHPRALPWPWSRRARRASCSSTGSTNPTSISRSWRCSRSLSSRIPRNC